MRRERERDQEAWEEERLERQRERERESTEAALALGREREREREERERERELKVSRKWLRFSEFLQFEERGRKQEQAHILKKKKMSLCWDYCIPGRYTDSVLPKL